jgi:hypothetical protein
MNKERQIQLLYPPLFFLAALAFAGYLDTSTGIATYLKDPKAAGTAGFAIEKILGIAAAGGILIIVAGFLIGTVSILLLRLGFLICGLRHYETALPEDFVERIWPMLDTQQKFDKSLHKGRVLYATATFDHEVIPEKMHDWLFRRWSSFNICVRSCVALALSWVVVWQASISPGENWKIYVSVTMVLFGMHATLAWVETMKMLKFQSYRKLPLQKAKETRKTSPQESKEKTDEDSTDD